MTTPDTTPTLAQVGDVVTEDIQLVYEVGVNHLFVAVNSDGSRKVHGRWGLSSHSSAMNILSASKRLGYIPIYWGLDSREIFRSMRGDDKYLPYPPAGGGNVVASTEPVNQIPYMLEWMGHISTFAHEIDTMWSEHSLILRDGENYNMIPGSAIRDSGINLRNQTALRYGRGICGNGFEKVDDWSKLDPLGTRWVTEKPNVQDDVEALCLVCDHAHWLRQFLVKHDVLPWQNSLDEVLTHPVTNQQYMRVPKIDKSGELWLPSSENITTIAGNAPINWWKRQMVNYGKAVDWYDEHFGRRGTT